MRAYFQCDIVLRNFQLPKTAQDFDICKLFECAALVLSVQDESRTEFVIYLEFPFTTTKVASPISGPLSSFFLM